MPKTFVLHDETVNTYGFRMLTSGCDLSEFIKNPVMLYNHNDWSTPIGRWENIRVEGSRILADAVFDLKDTRENGGAEIGRKVNDDFLRMASIGAWPPDEVSDDPIFMMSNQTRPTVTRWKAREASIVSIGSNHNSLCFYDKEGNIIDLADMSSVIRLMDTAPKKSFTNTITMHELNQILNLSDTATDAERAAAMRLIIKDRDRLKGENVTLADSIDKLTKEAKEKRKAETITLVDAAIKDGRINADAKESYIKLFDLDFESAKKSLESIPSRRSVSSQIPSGGAGSDIELADLTKMSWDELDRNGKLVILKDKYYDVYKQKFEARFPGATLKAE